MIYNFSRIKDSGIAKGIILDFIKETIAIDTDTRGTEDLCLMCGKCCKAVATSYKHEELVEMAKDKQKEAQVFVDFFKKYNTIDDARKIVPDQVEQVLDIRKKKGENIEEASFYYCNYVDENNMCTMHSERPLCCRTAPGNGWSLMPPECGYEGWQFEEREKLKATIRVLKENLHEVEALYGDDDKIPDMKDTTVRQFRTIVKEKIGFFKAYGSEKW